MAVESDVEVWSEPLGHGKTVRGLWKAARATRLPHALLFQGSRGIGKYLAARWLALGLLCERPGADGTPCTECGACKRAMGGSHGDLFMIDVADEPEKERSEELRIGRFVARDEDYWRGSTVEDFFGHRALEGGWRIVIVREIERANVEAQNALLKMLEEPPEQALWVLETSQADALLPTIKSRCVRVEFDALATREVETLLGAADLDPQRVRLLARWSRGSPGRAFALAANAGVELRQLLLDLLAGKTSATAAARTLWELDGDFAGKTAKAAERQRARFALDLWIDVLRDMAALSAGEAPERVAHGDLGASLEPALAARAPRAILALLELRLDIEANVDPPALLDRATLTLAPGRREPDKL